MKAINKQNILSKTYREWWKSDKTDYPKYRADHSFYLQVKMSLLHCQNGLCAYTESKLCSQELCHTSRWNSDGEYSEEIKPDGDIEHFDFNLKTSRGWDWDNLFVTRKIVNNTKLQKPVYNILKPDLQNYDVSVYLSYDYSLHTFYVKSDIIDPVEIAQITHMILALGLNHDAVIDDRKDAFKQMKLILDYSGGDYDYIAFEIIREFPTAFAMSKDYYLQNKDNIILN